MYSGSENVAMIQKLMKEGSIAPSDVTVKLIKKVLESAENHKFLIDTSDSPTPSVATYGKNVVQHCSLKYIVARTEERSYKAILLDEAFNFNRHYWCIWFWICGMTITNHKGIVMCKLTTFTFSLM